MWDKGSKIFYKLTVVQQKIELCKLLLFLLFNFNKINIIPHNFVVCWYQFYS